MHFIQLFEKAFCNIELSVSLKLCLLPFYVVEFVLVYLVLVGDFQKS
jgi:hypothetical protein